MTVLRTVGNIAKVILEPKAKTFMRAERKKLKLGNQQDREFQRTFSQFGPWFVCGDLSFLRCLTFFGNPKKRGSSPIGVRDTVILSYDTLYN